MTLLILREQGAGMMRLKDSDLAIRLVLRTHVPRYRGVPLITARKSGGFLATAEDANLVRSFNPCSMCCTIRIVISKNLIVKFAYLNCLKFSEQA